MIRPRCVLAIAIVTNCLFFSCKTHSEASTTDSATTASIDAARSVAPPEGTPPVIVNAMKSPFLIGKDRDALYVVENNVMTAFKRIEKKTGAATEYSIPVPWAVASDNQYLYVAHEMPTGGELVRMSKAPSPKKPDVLAKIERTAALQIDGDNLYWLERDRGLMSLPIALYPNSKPKMLDNASNAAWLMITPETIYVAGEDVDDKRVAHLFLSLIPRSGGAPKRIPFKGRHFRALAIRDKTFFTVTSEATMGANQNVLRAYSLDTGEEQKFPHLQVPLTDVRSLAPRGDNLFLTQCLRNPIDPDKAGPPSELLRMSADGNVTSVTKLYEDSCASALVTDDRDAIYLATTHGIAKVTTSPY